MSKQTVSLTLAERNGRETTYVDPNNIDSIFRHNSQLLKRTIGREKVRVVRNTASLSVSHNYKSCDDQKCGTKIFESASVTLSGSSVPEMANAWEALKLNMDRAIAEYKILNGIPLPLDANGFVVINEVADSPSGP